MSFAKVVITILIIAVIAGAAFYFFGQDNDQQQYITEIVEPRNLIRTVSATGSVESADQINLSFEVSGKLDKIFVSVGDEVEAGQTLAQLNTSVVAADVSQARARVVAAEADLEKVNAGASREDIEVTKKQVDQAETDIIIAKNNLDSMQTERDDKIGSLRETALNNLSAKNFYSRTALDLIDSILNDPDAKSVLSVKDVSHKITVTDSFSKLDDKFSVVADDLKTINSDSSNQEIIDMLTELINYQTDILGLLENVYLMLENTVTSSSYSQTDLDTHKSSVKTQQSNIDTSLTALQTSKTNLSEKVVYYNKQIQSLEDTLSAKQEALELMQAQLELKISGPRSFEIRSAEAALQQAEANLQTTLANLSKYIIKAPISGTIVSIDKDKGEQVTASETVMKLIGESELEIEVDIPEADIALVKEGDIAEITLDAYGSSLLFTGHVTFIEPAETVIQDVVYYKVKVQFDLADQAIKPGMTANLDIKVAEKNDVLAVPIRSIISDQNKRFVKILMSDGEVVERQVTTGLRSDDGYIEVISGVQMGNEVIIAEKNGE